MALSPPDAAPAVFKRISQSARIQSESDFHKLSFQAMSTACGVHFRTPDAALARQFAQQTLQWVAWFEAHYSRFIPESLISRINAEAGRNWVEVDPETDALLNLCHDLIFFTRGVFDPTALPLIRLWNWKASPPAPPGAEAVQAALELVGWRKVQRRQGAIFLPRPGMCLDLGGIGKEYAVDRVMTMALERGIKDVMVDFGQDVRAHGKSPGKPAWHIGLEDGRIPGRCWNGVAVTNHAVATSGDYNRHFIHAGRRYGHIIDPRHGYPVDNGLLSVSVIAPTCTMAGLLSTTAFVLGPKDGAAIIALCPGAEGCLTTASDRYQTKGFYAFATN